MTQVEVKVGNILDYGGGGRFVVIDLPGEGGYSGAKFMPTKDGEEDGEECLHVCNSTGDEGPLLKVEERVLTPEDIFLLIMLGSANGQHNIHQWIPSLEDLKEAINKPGIMVALS